MNIETVFFDFDNTLCQTTASRPELARHSAKVLLPYAQGMSIEKLVQRILTPKLDGFPMGVRALIDELGSVDEETAARAIEMWFFRGCEHLIRSFDGTHQVIEVLKPLYHLGIITNGDFRRQHHKFKALTFHERFDPQLFVCSGAVGYEKPDPEIFRYALASANVEPRHAVMVGDWALGDVGGAQAVGIRGVWFNPEGLDVPEGVTPDATIQRFDELPGLLREWSD